MAPSPPNIYGSRRPAARGCSAGNGPSAMPIFLPGRSPIAAGRRAPQSGAMGRGSRSPAADQWQLAATCFAALTGEVPPPQDIPPVRFVRPDCPEALAVVIDTALRRDAGERYRSVSLMLKALERSSGARRVPTGAAMAPNELTEEARLRWATSDDYDVLGFLGRGTFGSVWRARDLSLEREVALKMLHPDVAQHPARSRASCAKRGSPRSSPIRRSSRSTIWTHAVTSRGTRWNWPRRGRWRISSSARGRARLTTLRRKSKPCWTRWPRHTRQASCIATSSRKTS